MKRIIISLLVILSVLSLAACQNKNSAANIEARQQKGDAKALITNQPLPHFNYSQIRQNTIELEIAQAEGVQTTTFFFNQGVRDPTQSCPSIGAPIPTTTQISNPNQIVNDPYGNGGAVVGQMDPNGVYTGNSSGTYVMCIGANGKTYANYWEGFVQTVFAPAHWDNSTHQVVLDGSPSFSFTGGKG